MNAAAVSPEVIEKIARLSERVAQVEDDEESTRRRVDALTTDTRALEMRVYDELHAVRAAIDAQTRTIEANRVASDAGFDRIRLDKKRVIAIVMIVGSIIGVSGRWAVRSAMIDLLVGEHAMELRRTP